MNGFKVKEIMEQIHISEEMQEDIIMNVQKRMKNRKSGTSGWKRGAVAAAAVVLIGGVAGIPVRALVNSIVQERMEKVPEEEIQTTLHNLDNQTAEAESQTRDYTESEKERMKELRQKYMEGTFPESELPQVDTEAEAESREFCFLTTTGKFYLPSEREMTDEEILEIIDFREKRDYALAQRNEERDAANSQKKAQIEAEGGITEEKAESIARDCLQGIFGLDGSGMEFDHHFNEADNFYDVDNYYAGWQIRGDKWYQFTIGANDGEILHILFVDNDWRNTEQYQKPGVNEASAMAASIKGQAADVLKDTLGIDEEFEKVETCYYATDDEVVSKEVDVYFVKKDGSAYAVQYRWEGVFAEYYLTDAKEYGELIDIRIKQFSDSLAEERGQTAAVKAVRE